ncbi:MAG: hypothetical protein KGQ59_04725, partial [Bdellovibrionales bacterium]|nr:hypothetical protein [Bdellovibrionales bacterium]
MDPVEFAASHGIKGSKHFKHAVKGFVAIIDDLKLSKIKDDSRVLLVEQDRYAAIEASGTQSGATWGLDRIDQRSKVLDGKFNYLFSGKGVTAYVIDTGIRYD